MQKLIVALLFAVTATAGARAGAKAGTDEALRLAGVPAAAAPDAPALVGAGQDTAGHRVAQMHGHPAPSAAASPAKTFKLGNLTIETPWLRATPRGARVAGGYMKITNTGTETDRLVGGTIEGAGRFEVHEMKIIDNVMQMRPLPNGLEIKPGATVELMPGGFHVMALDLQHGYSEGQTVKGTLNFARAGALSIEYAVAPIGSGGPSGHHR